MCEAFRTDHLVFEKFGLLLSLHGRLLRSLLKLFWKEEHVRCMWGLSSKGENLRITEYCIWSCCSRDKNLNIKEILCVSFLCWETNREQMVSLTGLHWSQRWCWISCQELKVQTISSRVLMGPSVFKAKAKSVNDCVCNGILTIRLT